MCSKGYPKPFADKTIINEDGYPTYRRRFDRRVFKKTIRGVEYVSTIAGLFPIPYPATAGPNC